MNKTLIAIIKISLLLLVSPSATVNAMGTSSKRTPEIATAPHQPHNVPEQKCAAISTHDKQPQQRVLTQMATGKDPVQQSQYPPSLGIATITTTHIKDVIAMVEWNNNGNSKNIVFYNLKSEQISAIWPDAHTSPITALATLPNGNLISGANNGNENLKIWEPRSGKCLHTLSIKDGSFSTIAALSDTLIAFGLSWSRRIYIWDTEKNSISSYLQHEHPIAHLVASKSGHLLSCDIFDTIKIWDWLNGELHCLYTTPPDYINTLTIQNTDSLTPCDGIDSMTIMPDGTLVTGYRGDVFFWQISAIGNNIVLSFIKRVPGENDMLVALTITPDNHLVAGFSRGQWNAWNLGNLKLKKGVTHGNA